MTHRILPREEWPRLEQDDTSLVDVWKLLPESTQVLVVEDDQGAIVGCWAFLWAVHAEGVWIREDHQGKAAVARHLLRGMRTIVPAMGGQAVWTAAMNPSVAAMLEALGAEPFPASYTFPVTKGVH